MADYSQYQGPSSEWTEFTKTTHVPAAGPGPGQSIEEYQKVTNAGREKLAALTMERLGLRASVSLEDFQVPTRDGQTIPVRLYRPLEVSKTELIPVYVFFHGGGFFFGTLASEDARCSKIALELRIAVLNVCYRHTPAFKHPTPFYDASDAFEWTTKHVKELGIAENQIVIGGISAGGGLAASTMLGECHPVVGRRRIKGQVLCIPSLIPPEVFPFHLMASEEITSYYQNINSPILPKTQRELFNNLSEVKSYEETPYGKYEIQGMDLTSIPKTAFLVAGMDALRDEALLYAKRLRASSVPTHVYVFPGVPHGFHRYEGLSATQKWEAAIIDSIKWIIRDGSSKDDYFFKVE